MDLSEVIVTMTMPEKGGYFEAAHLFTVPSNQSRLEEALLKLQPASLPFETIIGAHSADAADMKYNCYL